MVYLWSWPLQEREKSWKFWKYEGVLNPHSKSIQTWNKVFVVSCLLGIFLDPLFFFPLSVDEVLVLASWTFWLLYLKGALVPHLNATCLANNFVTAIMLWIFCSEQQVYCTGLRFCFHSYCIQKCYRLSLHLPYYSSGEFVSFMCASLSSSVLINASLTCNKYNSYSCR